LADSDRRIGSERVSPDLGRSGLWTNDVHGGSWGCDAVRPPQATAACVPLSTSPRGLDLEQFWPCERQTARLLNQIFASRQSQRLRITATSIPANCDTTKAATPAGAIPAKVLDSDRAMVTAGLAKDVEAVNQ
jgi:hypothetical protein